MAEDAPRRADTVRATIAFVDVLGFTPLAAEIGTERAYLAMTRCMRELDGIARHHGGSVDKYLGDRLMAVFGHPVPLDRPPRWSHCPPSSSWAS
jgi:class 3 adenylate cyclase